MRYLSLFSGIEAATVAWRPLGWSPIAFAEVDRAACAVLRHHYQDVPNLGDVEGFHDWPDMAPAVIVGGSPCQSFSIAGLRRGLDDSRGNLALVFCGIVGRYRPRWLVWENVPGALSADRGRAFGAILRALAEFGYGLAWRVLDAQHVRVDGFCRALPQRRRRLYLVGHLGDARRAGAVLFDSEGGGRRSPPRKGARKDAAGALGTGAEGGRVAFTLTARYGQRIDPLDTEMHIVFNARQTPVHGQIAGALDTYAHTQAVLAGDMVRRLTPVECERLQGFPDGYTAVPDDRGRILSDTARYRLIGNSMPVNVMRWIGLRMAMVDAGEIPLP